MGAVEVAGIGLHRDREMLLDRGGAGERGGIQPGRHRDDHQRAESHAAEQKRARPAFRDMRQEPQQEGPERIDADRDRDRIDHGCEEHDGRVAVEQIADAEIGVDAACEREHAECHARGDFQALNALTQGRYDVGR